jgi:hypothetical protein
MADRNRRFTLAAIALPFLFVMMSGLARATTFIVNTTDGESPAAPLCSLPDAITAHNIHAPMNGCPAGSSNDTIFFAVTGTISIDEPLEITSGEVTINGPIFGCSGPGPCGITIDGEGSVEIILADPATSVFLNALTLADGFASSDTAGGGAIFANGTELGIDDCLFRNNQAAGPSASVGGKGGAILGNAGIIVIVNSTFANNTAVHGSSIGSEGGAIFFANPTTEITNSTFEGNTADDGGGYGTLNSGTVPHVKGTLFAANTGGNCFGNPFDLNYNISDDVLCGFSMPQSLNNTNPLLEPLANNGGPTETFALETSPSVSPAIDRIPVANCTDQQGTPQPLGTDQRLFARPDPGNLTTCDSGAYEVGAVAPFTLNSERVQIARSSTLNSDKVNIGATFTENGDPLCDLDEDALNDGVGVSLFQGTCASLPNSGLSLFLAPFVVHTVNHQSYGTLFQINGPETVSARLVALRTPANTCGQWTLNLEVTGLNTPAIGLGGGNPFALVLSDNNGDGEGCFDITNAIVGTQIPTPAHSVRRGVRRQNRR